VQDLKKSSDAYELIVNQLKEVEKNLKQANDKRDNLITNLSKLDDEFNKKNLRKLSLNFEDLQDAGEKGILFFLTEEEISFSDIKTLT
ncbi:hypothetical protein ABTE84_20095, partial [Acinetobacter baumannii]